MGIILNKKGVEKKMGEIFVSNLDKDQQWLLSGSTWK